tara:strand:- start:85 stop:603 length:519 start_codon:yes stop_codon:yes gene_type:complete
MDRIWNEGDKIPMAALFVLLLDYWSISANPWLNVNGLDSPYRTWETHGHHKVPSLMSWGCAIEHDLDGPGWGLYDRNDHLATNGIKMDCFESAEEALTGLLGVLDISPQDTMVAYAYHNDISTPTVEFMAPNGITLRFPGYIRLKNKTCKKCGREFSPDDSYREWCFNCSFG